MSGVKKCLLFFLFLGQAFVSNSQNLSPIDSALNILQTQSPNTEESITIYKWLYQETHSDKNRLKYAKELLKLAQLRPEHENLITANFQLGMAHAVLGSPEIALEHLFEAASMASNAPEHQDLLIDIYNEISACYTLNADSKNAILYGTKAIEQLRDSGNKEQLAMALINLGYDYYLINRYDSALSYYNESEPIVKEVNNEIILAYLIGNRALVYWKTNRTDRAKADLFLAIEMLKEYGDQFGMADYYNQLGRIFLQEDDIESAIQYTLNGLEMAQTEGLKEQVRDASLLLSKLYNTQQKHKQSAIYLAQHYAYRDSIQSPETTQNIADLRTEFEVGQKQAEVDLLREKQRSNQIIIIAGGITLIIVICMMIVLYSKAQLSKRLEEQKDALLSLNNTKDKFFSIVSHDLRGPVGNLSGLVSIMKYAMHDPKSENFKDLVDKMEYSVDHVVKLLDNLLHWALQQQGHIPYVPDRYDVNDMLSEVHNTFREVAGSKKIELSLDVEEGLSFYVDKNTAKAIFRNLLNNSLKFTPEGGVIQIRAESKGTFAAIKFSDSGVGISPEKLKTLFDFQGQKDTKGTSGETGLGIGLHLVHDFVVLNKGQIQVESELSQGTTFTVELPVQP